MYNSPVTIYENIMQQEMEERENQYDCGFKDGVEAERKRWMDSLTYIINHPNEGVYTI